MSEKQQKRRLAWKFWRQINDPSKWATLDNVQKLIDTVEDEDRSSSGNSFVGALAGLALLHFGRDKKSRADREKWIDAIASHAKGSMLRYEQ